MLDLTRLLPGGYATLLMADLGADVVKLEQPGRGDYIRWTPPMVEDLSASHIALNRNKRSVTLDLKTERGRDIFLDLAGGFDLVVESFRPGVMDRLGVGWEVLHKRHPRLIYCAITGYGQDGPRALTAGHDVNYIGYAGVLGINGAEDDRPVIPGVQVGDLAGGGMAAVIAVLSALLQRATTGRGDFCDIAMMDGAVSWLSIHAGEFVATGRSPQRERMHLSGAYPCYRVYPAADGWLSVGALEPQFWAALCTALERPDLANDGFAVGERKREVIAELEALFARHTRAEWMERFEGRDVCVGPVNDFAEAFDDPQVRHRDMVYAAEVPGVGDWQHIGNPIRVGDTGGKADRSPPPRLGEHTAEILGETGLGADEVEELRAAGIV
ncbi:MAG TPA: CaiB/BaiF CoA-transferase family protein, partial [Actinomycetota bacterium]|nr:CaiB/BaiF CoA-transferase family protein [Actinomycetota bacterium]